MNYRRTVLVFFSVVFILSFCNFDRAWTQNLRPRSDTREKQDIRRPLRPTPDEQRDEKQPRVPGTLTLPSQSLETAIDPETYLIGPGDTFQIGIWTGDESELVLVVNPEGRLTIPTVGTLDVAKKPLQTVRELIKKRAAKKYIGAPISVNLVALRRFRVHVTGQVLNPGLYEALAVDRVSDLISKAGGVTNWADERKIEVRHRNGGIETSDLYRYSKLGDLDANLLLQGGDVIYVPFIDFQQATVRVEGLLNDPGIYQLLDNETIEQFLLRVDAMNRRADLKNAFVRRQSADSDGVENIDIFPYLSGSGNGHAELYLRDGDVIFIPKRSEEVFVVGAVQKPGSYPFYPNYRAIDYVGLAGSTERAANLTSIKVVREGGRKVLKGGDLLARPGDTIVIPEKKTFGVREISLITGQLATIILALNAVGVFK